MTKAELEADLAFLESGPDKAELGDRACRNWPRAIRAALAALTRIEELRHTFDLRWKADMRAVERWREAAPGRELELPDHADLVVFLLEKAEAE